MATPATSGLIRGHRVALRPALPADRERVWEWAVSPDNAPILYPEGPPALDGFRTGYQSHYFDGSDPLRGRSYIIVRGDAELGHINSNEIDRKRGRTELDIWMAGEARCGHGDGSAAVELLADHLCLEHGVVKCMMQPSARNPRAIRAYQKARFRALDIPLAEAESDWGPADQEDSVYMVRSQPARIRRCDSGDLPFLEDMLYQAVAWDPAGEAPSRESALALPELAKLLHGFGERPGDAGLIAVDSADQTRRLGAAWFRLWNADDHSYGFLDDATPELAIAAIPASRGAGIGGLLLRTLTLEAGRIGFDRLSLSVAHGNPARRLYEKLGFVEQHDDGDAATLLLELAR